MEIKQPRNVFIHRAIRAKQISQGDSRVLALRHPEKYSSWSAVQKALASPEILNTELGDVAELAAGAIRSTANVINNIWVAVWNESGNELQQRIPKRTEQVKDHADKLQELASALESNWSTSTASGVVVARRSDFRSK
jgi:hypothetical protein